MLTHPARGRAIFNQSGPLTIMATSNTSTKALHIFISNFAPDDGKALVGASDGSSELGQQQPEICYSMRPNKCTEESCYLPDTDFVGGDLLPESQKFTTPNASACCSACLHYKVDKFCQAWVHADPEHAADPDRCYLKTGAALSHRRHSKGMTAGFPTGVPPPASPSSWYNASHTVKITVGTAADSASPAASGGGTATLRMINSTCANAKTMWLGEMGSSPWPSEAQLAQLKLASKLCEEEVMVVTDAVSGERSIEVTLEAYAAAELVLTTAA